MSGPPVKPTITIRYCPRCGWLLRSAWLAQEILTTFSEDVKNVSLEPAESGEFEILLGDERLWERKTDGGFPAAKELKRRIRDRIDPGRGLGHVDS